MEGEGSGEWVLVDLGSIVVHIMQPAVRAYYNLEELWQTTPAARKPHAPPARTRTELHPILGLCLRSDSHRRCMTFPLRPPRT